MSLVGLSRACDGSDGDGGNRALIRNIGYHPKRGAARHAACSARRGPVSDKRKPAVRRGRNATGQAWGLTAGVGKNADLPARGPRYRRPRKGRTMRNRSSWRAWVTLVLTGVVLITGITVPAAQADPKGKPGLTPPGVPPGRPFQALQKEIDALSTRVTTLEALAPQSGLMWVNPLDFLALGSSTLALDPTGPGLDVTGAAAGSDSVQVGLHVPLGFSVTGA